MARVHIDRFKNHYRATFSTKPMRGVRPLKVVTTGLTEIHATVALTRLIKKDYPKMLETAFRCLGCTQSRLGN